MTSKVQTITAQIYDMAIEDSAHVQIVALTDALIAASHAEGVAEGREQMRLKVLEAADEYMVIPAFAHCNVWNEFSDKLRLVPSSVLAPTKEGEKSYYGGQSATSSGDHWEQKLIHGPEMTGKP